jgi:hypothetical protein
MNRKTLKLRRLAAVVAVLAAFAIPCAGWGWEGPDDGGGSPDSSTAALVE